MENCGDMITTRQAQKSRIGLVMKSEQHHDFSKYLVEKYSCPDISKYIRVRSCSSDERLIMRIKFYIDRICSRMPDSNRETYLRRKYMNEYIFGLVFFRSRRIFSFDYIKEQDLEMRMEDLYDDFKDYILSEGWEIGPKRAEK